MGITNTLSFIVEGINGKTPTDNIKSRAESQFLTALNLIKIAGNHSSEILEMVENARSRLKKQEIDKTTVIRMNHVKGDDPLLYPLYSIARGKDTLFRINQFHSYIFILNYCSSTKYNCQFLLLYFNYHGTLQMYSYPYCVL